ncbi:MAG: AMP-binding protein, partial [Pseudomonadota bacterium]
MTIDRWISGRASSHPDHPAIVFQGETWSYADFEDRIAETTAALTAAGVGIGDRIAWYGLNRPEVFSLMFACARLRAILCPLNWRLAAAEIAGIVDDCAPRLVVYDDHFAHPAQALAGEGRKVAHFATVPDLIRDRSPQAEAPAQGRGGGEGADAPLLIVYTSGSTGRPKGAVLSQSAVEASAV